MTARKIAPFTNLHGRWILLPLRRRGDDAGKEHHTRAQRWFEGAINSWVLEGRVTLAEAEKLRVSLNDPQFLAVLPHFGVHLAIGAVLRFPIGSITRASYVLVNLLLATLRLLTRNIDRHEWRQAFGIHSPLVILLAGMPGIGTFAYLASRPMRSDPLLLRVGIDAVLMKLPRNVYERSGLRWVIARPKAIATQPVQIEQPPLRLTVWPQSIVLALGLIAGGLFAADFMSQLVNEFLAPDIPGWPYIMRILDLNAEQSLGTWFVVLFLLFLSALLFVVAFATGHAADRFGRHWFILAFLPLAFSLDEQAKLHDPGGLANSVRDQLPLSGPLYTGWVVFGLVSVLIVAWFFKAFVLELPLTTRHLFMLAAALFVSGELVLEMASGWYLDIAGSENLIYQMLTTLEESLAIAGIVVAIAAMLHYIQTHFGEIRVALQEDRLAEQQATPPVNYRGAHVHDTTELVLNQTSTTDDENADRATQAATV